MKKCIIVLLIAGMLIAATGCETAKTEQAPSRRELDGARYYKPDGGRDTYLIPVGEDAYLMLSAESGDGERCIHNCAICPLKAEGRCVKRGGRRV